MDRPLEGDLIYFPLSKGLFEIKFVEHQNPFYQLGKLYTYQLSCELFQYSQEDMETGWSDVDAVETTNQETAIDLVFSDSTGTFVVGESATTAGGFSSKVVLWTSSTKTLRVHGVSGSISGSDIVTGSDSGATGTFSTQSDTTEIIAPDPFDMSDDFQVTADDLFDFTDIDPFSDGEY